MWYRCLGFPRLYVCLYRIRPEGAGEWKKFNREPALTNPKYVTASSSAKTIAIRNTIIPLVTGRGILIINIWSVGRSLLCQEAMLRWDLRTALFFIRRNQILYLLISGFPFHSLEFLSVTPSYTLRDLMLWAVLICVLESPTWDRNRRRKISTNR